jgi:hypothetical protein
MNTFDAPRAGATQGTSRAWRARLLAVLGLVASTTTGCVAEEDPNSQSSDVEERKCADGYEIQVDSGVHSRGKPNDRRDIAAPLPAMRDNGGVEVVASWLGQDDVDWYVIHAEDTPLFDLEPEFNFVNHDGFEPSSVLDACVLTSRDDVECLLGEPIEAETEAESLHGCCAGEAPEGRHMTRIGLDTTLFDDSTDVYLRVRAHAGASLSSCAKYSFKYQGYEGY